jgi:hypothetical protein
VTCETNQSTNRPIFPSDWSQARTRRSNLSSNEHGSVLEKMVARQAAPDKVARARLDKAIEGQLTKKGTMYNSDMSGSAARPTEQPQLPFHWST